MKYPDREEDIFEKMVIGKAGSYNSFETSFLLEPQKSVQLTVTYDLPTVLSVTKENMNYGLYWQKQPGTHDDIYSFLFNAPFGLVSDQKSFEGALNADKQINIMMDPQ